MKLTFRTRKTGLMANPQSKNMSRVACKIEVVVQHELLQDSKRTTATVTRWSMYGRIPARKEDWHKHALTSAHTPKSMRTPTHTWKHKCARTHTYRRTYTDMCKYGNIYIYIYIYIYLSNFLYSYFLNTYSERKIYVSVCCGKCIKEIERSLVCTAFLESV